MLMLAGDMNGHVGCSNVGCNRTHGGYRYGARNADSCMILEFADFTPLDPDTSSGGQSP